MQDLKDNEKIDTLGEPRLIKHHSELFVVGRGWKVPVSDVAEAEEVIQRILDEPVCMMK